MKLNGQTILTNACAVVFAVLISANLSGQVLDPRPPNARPLFDPTHNMVFFGYGALKPGAPLLRAYIDGHQSDGGIDVFKDFPDLQYCVVNGFAGTVDGGSVLAGILGYGNNAVRHVILFYGSQGQLLKIWDTDPYYSQALAVDSDGDVYSLALRTDMNDKNAPDYPLLIHYRPDGTVAGKSLPKSLFREKTAEAITSVHGTLLPVLRIKREQVFVFAPTSGEVFIGSTKADVWQKYALPKQLAIKGLAKSEIENADFASNGDLVLELRGKNADSAVREVQRVNLKTGERQVLKKSLSSNYDDRFVGVIDDRYLETTLDEAGRRSLRAVPLIR